MAFWTAAAGAQDPKRGFRFIVTLGNMPHGASWFIKSSAKPTFKVEGAEHVFLNHTFHYPGKLTWEGPLDIELVDPVSPDAAAATATIIQASGYAPPAGPFSTGAHPTLVGPPSISKRASLEALGRVTIDQIDGDGRSVERWTLQQAWLSGVDYGDLKYDDSELTTIKLSIQYDWAELKTMNVAETGVHRGLWPQTNEFFHRMGNPKLKDSGKS